MEFSRQEYGSVYPLPPSRDLPNPGNECGSSELWADSLPSKPPGKFKSMLAIPRYHMWKTSIHFYGQFIFFKSTILFLNLINRVPDELCMEVHDIIQEAGIKTILKKKKWEKAQWLSEWALQIAGKRREVKAKEKRKDIPIWMWSSKE